MTDSPDPKKKPRPWLLVEPDPLPRDVPLEETVADIHFQGDIKGKYDGIEGARRLLEELEDPSWSARLKRFFGFR